MQAWDMSHHNWGEVAVFRSMVVIKPIARENRTVTYSFLLE